MYRILALCVLLLAGSESASALKKIIVPFPAGGSADGIARQLANALSTGAESVIVENIPGAGGVLAARALRFQPADGSVMLLATGAIAISPHTMDAGYDLFADFAPVAYLAEYPFVFAVKKGFPAADLAAYLRAVKTDESLGDFGSPGIDTAAHIIVERLARKTDTALRAVLYRGMYPVANDLLGKQIDAGILSAADVPDLGRFELLAVSGRRRLLEYPEVKTFAEQGYGDIADIGWFGALVPGGTSKEAVRELSGAVNAAMHSRRVAEWARTVHIEPKGSTPDEFAKILEDEYGKYRTIIGAFGRKPH